MSTYLDLPDRVRQYIRDKFHKEYLSTLDYYTKPICDGVKLYVLTWGLNQWMFPFVMQGEFTSEDNFFNYIVKQIGSTKFFETKHFIAYRIGKPMIEADHYIDPLLKFDNHVNREL